ncbi:hypothetical protein HDU92_004128 [Lobulomyces angularis]|nr:hypothetical protein HDU92_004128 [Lobulomyces angularis]
MGLNLMELPDELLEMIYINSCLLEIKDWKAAKSEVSSINSTTEDLHSDLVRSCQINNFSTSNFKLKPFQISKVNKKFRLFSLNMCIKLKILQYHLNLPNLTKQLHLLNKFQAKTLVESFLFFEETGIYLFENVMLKNLNFVNFEILLEYSCIYGKNVLLTKMLKNLKELKESDALKYFSLDSIINLCLIQSCMCNNYANCATIIQYGGNVNVDNGEPICMASKYGWTDVIELLIKNKADVNAQECYPLVSASRNGHYDSVKALLLAGANVDGENNGLPLCSAAELGYSSIVSILLEFGAKHDFLQDYAIRWASLSNHLACVEILCKYGANVNSMNNYALRNCVKLKLYDMVETLLINGADPLANSSECIKFAISTADDRMIKLLIGDYKSQNKRAVIEFEE